MWEFPIFIKQGEAAKVQPRHIGRLPQRTIVIWPRGGYGWHYEVRTSRRYRPPHRLQFGEEPAGDLATSVAAKPFPVSFEGAVPCRASGTNSKTLVRPGRLTMVIWRLWLPSVM